MPSHTYNPHTHTYTITRTLTHTISVVPTADAPLATALILEDTTEDATLTVTLSGNDVDGDTLVGSECVCDVLL
jgi:hypothetical protein